MDFDVLQGKLATLSYVERSLFALGCAERVQALYRQSAQPAFDAPERAIELGWRILLGQIVDEEREASTQAMEAELFQVLPETNDSPNNHAPRQAGSAAGMALDAVHGGAANSAAFAASHAISAISCFHGASDVNVEHEERWQEMALHLVRGVHDVDRNCFRELSEKLPPFTVAELPPDDERYMIHLIEVSTDRVVQSLAVGATILDLQNYANSKSSMLSPAEIFVITDHHDSGSFVLEGRIVNGKLSWLEC